VQEIADTMVKFLSSAISAREAARSHKRVFPLHINAVKWKISLCLFWLFRVTALKSSSLRNILHRLEAVRSNLSIASCIRYSNSI
jgi:hypothetical protein